MRLALADKKVVTRLFLSIALAGLAAAQTAQTAGDYRSRMHAVNISEAFEAAKPDISLLPTGKEWVTHIQRDLLPYWTTPVALGNPVGNFPTFLANDGSLIDPKNLPKEVRDIDSSETWLLNRVGRQYTRTMSRQIYAYCVAYHMTGDEQYLRYAKAGMDYMFTKMVDKDGVFYTWIRRARSTGPEAAHQPGHGLRFDGAGDVLLRYARSGRAGCDAEDRKIYLRQLQGRQRTPLD
jgi:hypothetical protein